MRNLTKNFKKIGKNVIVNTTPHPISFLKGDETIVVNTDAEFILNAKATEKAVSEIFVTTEFVGTAEGNALIDDIEEWFNEKLGKESPDFNQGRNCRFFSLRRQIYVFVRPQRNIYLDHVV